MLDAEKQDWSRLFADNMAKAQDEWLRRETQVILAGFDRLRDAVKELATVVEQEG